MSVCYDLTYQEKLKDPRWKERSKQIRDNYENTCCACGGREIELHVHHNWYEKGKQPWDYPDECFIVLCKKCHKKIHDIKSEYCAEDYFHVDKITIFSYIYNNIQFNNRSILTTFLSWSDMLNHWQHWSKDYITENVLSLHDDENINVIVDDKGITLYDINHKYLYTYDGYRRFKEWEIENEKSLLINDDKNEEEY